jgi:hypothetical protein
VAGAWYATRFSGVIEAIEQDSYHLRRDYSDCKGSRTILRMLWNGIRAMLPTVTDEEMQPQTFSAPYGEFDTMLNQRFDPIKE